MFEANQFWIIVQDYRVFIGTDVLIFGLMMTFFGRKLIKIIVFLAGIIAGMMGVLILYFVVWYNPANQKEWEVYTVFTVGTVIGLIIGYLLTKSVRVAQAFVAGYMGFSVGMIVNSLVLYMLESETVFWVTITCFTLGMATLGCVCHNKHMCWITALAGAYITMRGLALVTGHA